MLRRRPVPCAGSLRGLARAIGAAGLALASVMVAACSSLSDIDRRVEAALAQADRELDGGAIAPSPRRKTPPSPERTPEQIAKRPPSLNPPATDLLYKVAPDVPVRERLARLNEYSKASEGGRLLTLSDAFQVSQVSAREYLDAEEEYVLASIRLLIERHRWGPRFFDDLSVGVDNTPAFTGGNYTSALNVINTLRATQRLPYGGEIEARAITRATEQLREVVGVSYTQSTQVVLGANVPLLRGAGLIAQEDLIQAERNVVYAARTFENFRRAFLVTIARDYFELVRQQEGIKNQQVRLVSVRQNERYVAAQVEAGRRRAFERRNVEQNVLRSETDLVNARERFLLALDRFKLRLGLPVSDRVALEPVAIAFPEPDVTPEQAVDIAMRYRLDLQNRRDQLRDAERVVANSRNQLLPDLNLRGDVSLNTPRDVSVGGVGLEFDHTVYNASATLSLPLDREIERLNLRASIISLQRQSRELSRFEDDIALTVRSSVREVDRARFALELQNQSVRINELRLEELKLKIDETDPQQRLDAENELLDSRNARDSADRDLRVAILNYLTSTGMMRIAPDGRFQPLEGMNLRGEGVAPMPDDSATPAPAPEPDNLLDEIEGEPALQQPEDQPPPEPAPPPASAPATPPITPPTTPESPR